LDGVESVQAGMESAESAEVVAPGHVHQRHHFKVL
jgi:hypothetical protein